MEYRVICLSCGACACRHCREESTKPGACRFCGEPLRLVLQGQEDHGKAWETLSDSL